MNLYVKVFISFSFLKVNNENFCLSSILIWSSNHWKCQNLTKFVKVGKLISCCTGLPFGPFKSAYGKVWLLLFFLNWQPCSSSLSVYFLFRARTLLSLNHLPCVSGFWTSLTWLWWFSFRLILSSGNDLAAPEIVAHVKMARSDTKNNHLATFIKVQSKFLIHSVAFEGHVSFMLVFTAKNSIFKWITLVTTKVQQPMQFI